MSSSPRIRLSLMMFLQYAIWGIWVPNLGLYLSKIEGFSQTNISLIYMTMPIASIIAPFIAGQIADRYFAAQRFLAVSQVLGGVVLLVIARLTGFIEVFVGMLVYNILYAPTIAITNSIVFHHWPNERFSRIRVWGSIGWIVIGWVFGLWLERAGGLLGRAPSVGDWFYIAAVLSLVMGAFALVLPHTPPSKKAGNPWAFLDAFALMRNRAFAVMAVIAFFTALEMQYYFIQQPVFFSQGLHLRDSWVGPVATFGQICEMVMMVLLPLALRRFGYRVTMALGIAAWALRDFVFAIGQPTGLVIASVTLHGIGFAFFFTTIFMFADLVAPKDIKSSAQSFLSSVTIGLGMLTGSLIGGPFADYLQKDWHKVFLAPAVLCAVCCLVFLIGFRPKTAEAPAPAA
ncbi:MAG: MFS transporter [Phycisphaerae bacterium]